MKSQFFLLTTAIIVSLLSFILLKPSYIDFGKHLVDNFKNEVIYIWDNFDPKNLSDFVQKFKIYSENLGYNFTFICYTNINVSIPKCGNLNCCYYSQNKLIVFRKLWKCNRSVYLLPYKKWICFCFEIENKDEYYLDFFCT